MGLAIVPLQRVDDVRVGWAYSGFNEFRRKLAREVGLNLDAMIGFGGRQEWPDAEIEPLVYLLNHSDCDGSLDYTACEAVASRLREIVSRWPDLDDPQGLVDGNYFDRRNALALADMMDGVVRGDYEELLFS